MKKTLDRLEKKRILTKEEFAFLIRHRNGEIAAYLKKKATLARRRYYGDGVFLRGLIEFSNYCKNDCYYCGIRKSNRHADRYRLKKEEILSCCAAGYDLGFRTFVLQSGEDPYFDDDRMVAMIGEIKARYPDCAITLSIGEKPYNSYLRFFEAGADRYLLRHETANGAHYAKLHPADLSLENRMRCLWDLKRIGYQVGTGFMVGSPHQTPELLAEDLLFLRRLEPEMVGIGPFVPHHDTPFADMTPGTAELTLFMIGLIRLLLPNALIPATTALGTVSSQGREDGILAGANVVMPNLSPPQVRRKYLLYDNKLCTGEEAAECRACLEKRLRGIGCRVVVARGDAAPISE